MHLPHGNTAHASRRRPMAQALIEAAPDRLIWASDYPHLSFADKVGSVQLFNLLADWPPDDATRATSWSTIQPRCSASARLVTRRIAL